MAKKKKEDKSEAIETSRIDSIVKQFDKLNKNHGNIIVLGKDEPVPDIPKASTGLFSLDNILGGGLPHGRIIELYGVPSGGKSTTSLQIIASVQKNGGLAAYVDAEHSLDNNYAGKLGVDLTKLIVSQPDYGEQAFEVVESLSGLMAGGDIIVVDSVAALTPKAELEGDMEKNHVGLQARMIAQGLRKITASVAKTGVIVLFINQTRQNIGVMYGPKETTPGGESLKFYSSIRIDVRKSSALKKPDGSTYGFKTKIKVVKNKVFPPFRECELDMIFGEGMPRYIDLFNCALKEGIIEMAGGGVYYIDGEKYGRGRESVLEKFKEDNEMLDSIDSRLREIYKS